MHLSENPWFLLGLTPMQAVTTVIATIVLYVFFLIVSRLVGPRLVMKLSSFDILLAVALGSILGRAMMGHIPTAGAAIIVVMVLLLCEVAAAAVSVRPGMGRRINNQPVVVMAHGRFLLEEMKRCHITEQELNSRLRVAGVHTRAEVAAVIVEPTGEVSVLKEGCLVDPELIAGVRAGELI